MATKPPTRSDVQNSPERDEDLPTPDTARSPHPKAVQCHHRQKMSRAVDHPGAPQGPVLHMFFSPSVGPSENGGYPKKPINQLGK